MSDFISGFFSWGRSKKVEEPKEKEKEVIEKTEKDVHTFNNKSLRGSNEDIIGDEQE